MTRSTKALINPAMLTWARTSANLSIEYVAKKLKRPPERIQAWEDGVEPISVVQLRALGKVCHRPFAVFYLPAPPDGFAPLRDFRRLPGLEPLPPSPELTLEIRNAYEDREVALELAEAVDSIPPAFALRFKSSEDPETIAARIRAALDVTPASQSSWSHQTVLREWRTRVERLGVLVFQATTVDAEEVRGFSISQHPLPAVVVNRRESPAARCFSLFHELTHLSLNAAGLCEFSDAERLPPEKRRVEVFCNHVAGSVLVPLRDLLEQPIVIAHRSERQWPEPDIALLARRYLVSREVVLRRLLICDRISQQFYERKRREYRDALASAPRPQPSGFLQPYQDRLSARGRTFIDLVLEAWQQQKINASDASSILSLRIGQLGRLQSALGPEVL